MSKPQKIKQHYQIKIKNIPLNIVKKYFIIMQIINFLVKITTKK